MALTNPYLTDAGEPRLRNSLIAFLDILGFSKEIADAAKANVQKDHLLKLKAALSQATLSFGAEEEFHEEIGVGGSATYKVKVFTDNIVIGIPIFDDGESELGRLVSLVGFYQYTLIQHGFFVRGGVSVGEIFVGDDVVYGKGLLDAYAAESKLARDPRVVFDDSAMAIVHQHLTYYSRISGAPHNQDLLVDSDQQMFVNYLTAPLYGDITDAYLKGLDRHADMVVLKLHEHRNEPEYWAKYAWAASYHNVICTKFLGLEDHLIDPHLLSRPAQRLDEVYSMQDKNILRDGQVVASWKNFREQKIAYEK